MFFPVGGRVATVAFNSFLPVLVILNIDAGKRLGVSIMHALRRSMVVVHANLLVCYRVHCFDFLQVELTGSHSLNEA